LLGLGDIYTQIHPTVNPYFFNSTVIDISMSNKHACALDSCIWNINEAKKIIYTWGMGDCGELGQGELKTCNTPSSINLESHNLITKIRCGYSYTILLDCIDIIK
jgi:alpha-tubulin suppressor-like RCC1 family protein